MTKPENNTSNNPSMKVGFTIQTIETNKKEEKELINAMQPDKTLAITDYPHNKNHPGYVGFVDDNEEGKGNYTDGKFVLKSFGDKKNQI